MVSFADSNLTVTKQLVLVEFEELLPRSDSIYTILSIVEWCFNSQQPFKRSKTSTSKEINLAKNV